MKVFNPTEFVLLTTKNNKTWEILPKSLIEFDKEQSLNMSVDDRLIVTEREEILSDLES